MQEVDDLLQQIRDSEVQVEVDSSNSNLAEIIGSIRTQYQNMSARNLKATEDWYKNKVRVLSNCIFPGVRSSHGLCRLRLHLV